MIKVVFDCHDGDVRSPHMVMMPCVPRKGEHIFLYTKRGQLISGAVEYIYYSIGGGALVEVGAKVKVDK